MTRESKVEEKLVRKERWYDRKQRMKVKRSEEYEALEEVFDKPTLMAVYSLMNSGVVDKLFGVFRSGKEARIYRALRRDGKELAVKVFLTGSAEFRKGLSLYIQGDPRFGRVNRDSRELRYLWALKEFKNLRKAREVGVKVPEAIKIEKNILVMEFLGENGKPAPTLRE
ncbi:MAG: RIO1 family regulatory kinase/ATPase, partial [Candidatus Bathyarchaeia archaeon]